MAARARPEKATTFINDPLDACIKQGIMCRCRKCLMLSLGECSELTDARSPKNADAPGEVDDNTLVCDCIPVNPNFVSDILSREWIKFASRRVWLLPCHPEIGPLGYSFDTREYSELVD